MQIPSSTFLDYMAAQDVHEFKIMILDNGAFHHAKKLHIPTNMALLFLPPYSPGLNPAEKMWRHFKDRVSMVAYHNIEMLQNQISAILKKLTVENVKSIAVTIFIKIILKPFLMSIWY